MVYFLLVLLLSQMNKYNCLLDHKVVILQMWNSYTEAIASSAIARTLLSSLLIPIPTEVAKGTLSSS